MGFPVYVITTHKGKKVITEDGEDIDEENTEK